MLAFGSGACRDAGVCGTCWSRCSLLTAPPRCSEVLPSRTGRGRSERWGSGRLATQAVLPTTGQDPAGRDEEARTHPFSGLGGLPTGPSMRTPSDNQPGGGEQQNSLASGIQEPAGSPGRVPRGRLRDDVRRRAPGA
jgi:hypothetical protein